VNVFSLCFNKTFFVYATNEGYDAEPHEGRTMTTAAEIAAIRFFDDLDTDDRTTMAQYAKRQSFPKDTIIFYEGDPGSALCVVLTGTIGIGKEAVDGTMQIVSQIGPQDIFGEGALIDDVRRSATAIAHTDASVLLLTKTGFDDMSLAHPQLAIKVIRRTARIIRNRLRKASADLVDLLPH
jgi:CRP/FNR family cyclic AMP-dependent transcriptional regulator